MISYELAKRLKDAGFPLESEPSLVLVPEPQKDDEAWFEYPLGEVHWKPTLSELIEWCGERFDTLKLNEVPSREWEATGDEYFNGIGSTQEEAVAELGIALHTK